MRGGVLLDPHTGRPADERGRPVGLLEAGLRAAPAELREHRAEQMERVLEHLRLSRSSPARNYTRNKHYVSVRMAAVTAATARVAAGVLWNPHATSRIFVYEVWAFPTTAASINLGCARTTARGTASTSLAMAVGNSIENDTAAPSGAVLDSAWSVAPTVSAATMGQAVTPAAIGNGVILPFPDPVSVPAGSGFAMITVVGVAFPISDLTFVFGD